MKPSCILMRIMSLQKRFKSINIIYPKISLPGKRYLMILFQLIGKECFTNITYIRRGRKSIHQVRIVQINFFRFASCCILFFPEYSMMSKAARSRTWNIRKPTDEWLLCFRLFPCKSNYWVRNKDKKCFLKNTFYKEQYRFPSRSWKQKWVPLSFIKWHPFSLYRNKS